MSFRTVKINGRCKLETSMGYLVYRSDKEVKILIDEINMLIIENQQVCITSALIASLIEHKVRIVFCDTEHNPAGEVVPYGICYDSPAKIKKQFAWNEATKNFVWQKIVKQKIYNQAVVLKELNKEEAFSLLMRYYEEVTPGDTTNREGLAAKAYFAALFGNNFDRRSKSFKVNTYLNYGYQILLAAVNRAIAVYGYLTAVGIHHKGEQNQFNLGCDIMEPFRPFIDYAVVMGTIKEDDFKRQLINLLSTVIIYDDKNTIMDNAITFYVHDVLKALEKDDTTIMKELTRNGKL